MRTKTFGIGIKGVSSAINVLIFSELLGLFLLVAL